MSDLTYQLGFCVILINRLNKCSVILDHGNIGTYAALKGKVGKQNSAKSEDTYLLLRTVVHILFAEEYCCSYLFTAELCCSYLFTAVYCC